jgi:hypothetical protein
MNSFPKRALFQEFQFLRIFFVEFVFSLDLERKKKIQHMYRPNERNCKIQQVTVQRLVLTKLSITYVKGSFYYLHLITHQHFVCARQHHMRTGASYALLHLQLAFLPDTFFIYRKTVCANIQGFANQTINPVKCSHR